MFTKIEIEQYFLTEKNESLFFIIIGALAILLAVILFFFIKSNWNKGFAVPFFIMGLIHLGIGLMVYNTCDENRKANVYAYDMDRSAFKEKELPRMQKINECFIAYRYINIALLIVGIGLFLFFKNKPERQFYTGFGLAIAIEMTITLGSFYFAEKRAYNYINGLTEFISNPK